MHLGQRDISGEWMTSMVEQLHRVADPPEWPSLADRPALQGAARATFEQGCRWTDTKRRPLQPPEHRPGLFG